MLKDDQYKLEVDLTQQLSLFDLSQKKGETEFSMHFFKIIHTNIFHAWSYYGT
jgi:hypothetical protein